MKELTLNNLKLTVRTEPSTDDPDKIREMVSGTGFFRMDEVDIAVELFEERLKKGINSGYHFFIAENESEIIGYTCFGLIPCSLLSWDLYWIVTHKNQQGRGVGSALLQLTENEIQSNGGLNVVIETSSKELYRSTQQFYLRNGYELKARFEDFYDHGDDKFVYIKRI
jgi:ribosomal protein S18 acetylase RimI-like enzyme